MNNSLAEIESAIPHRPPFLLVDEIVARDGNRIVCRKRFTGEEWFFAGHYPDEPIVPGVLLCEAALQAGAILLGCDSQCESSQSDGAPRMPVVTRMNEVRFKHIVRPGDTIEIEVQLREKLSEAYFFDTKITCAGKLAARLEFACMLVTKALS
jgi:3-hydroxyacyl-[acyl-carrier-protein] dehydratase